MKKYAVIVAGGSGSRMGGPTPKQFLLLQGKTVLWHTVKVFLDAYEDMEIILVLPEEHLETGRSILAAAEADVSIREGLPYQDRLRRVRVVAGGATRFHSVQNGLQMIEGESVIFVHDGVRCLLTTRLVRLCYESALKRGSAIPVIDCRDSVRLISAGKKTPEEKTPEGAADLMIPVRSQLADLGSASEGAWGIGSEVIDRTRVKLVQTPQTFLSSVLLPAYKAEYRQAFTDEATVVEASGHPVNLVEGEPSNIKITMPVDLVLAEKILESATRGYGTEGVG